MGHLKSIAQRRTDIFGSGDVETAIGHKVGPSRPVTPLFFLGRTVFSRPRLFLCRQMGEEEAAAAAGAAGGGAYDGVTPLSQAQEERAKARAAESAQRQANLPRGPPP